MNLLIVALCKHNNNNYAEEYRDEEGDGEYEDQESGIEGELVWNGMKWNGNAKHVLFNICIQKFLKTTYP